MCPTNYRIFTDRDHVALTYVKLYIFTSIPKFNIIPFHIWLYLHLFLLKTVPVYLCPYFSSIYCLFFSLFYFWSDFTKLEECIVRLSLVLVQMVITDMIEQRLPPLSIFNSHPDFHLSILISTFIFQYFWKKKVF